MKNQTETRQNFFHENGVTYFTKKTERRILFVMTMAMLVWGVIEYTKEYF